MFPLYVFFFFGGGQKKPPSFYKQMSATPLLPVVVERRASCTCPAWTALTGAWLVFVGDIGQLVVGNDWFLASGCPGAHLWLYMWAWVSIFPIAVVGVVLLRRGVAVQQVPTMCTLHASSLALVLFAGLGVHQVWACNSPGFFHTRVWWAAALMSFATLALGLYVICLAHATSSSSRAAVTVP
jgi:hypothetical protein